MIEKVEMWGCRCDQCGEGFTDGCIIAWLEKDGVEYQLQESGWREVDDKWYCPECFRKLFNEDEEGNITRK